jgi:hypothetical protein
MWNFGFHFFIISFWRNIMPNALWRVREAAIRSEENPRERSAKFGECVQWEIGGRWQGPQGTNWWLIVLLDTATSHAVARFAPDPSAASQLSVLELWLRKYGRMSVCCTARQSFFQWLPGSGLDRRPREFPEDQPITQIGRALQELNIGWISCSYEAAEGGLAKFLRAIRSQWKERQWGSGQPALEQANAWIESDFLSFWLRELTVAFPAPKDAHRPLEESHDLASILSHVRTSRIRPDLTLRIDRRVYEICEPALGSSLAGTAVRVETRLCGVIAIRFQDRYLDYKLGSSSLVSTPRVVAKRRRKAPNAGGRSKWNSSFWLRRGPTLDRAIEISNATS